MKQIMHLIKKYLSIWEFLGFIQVLPKQWIKVHLKFDWESKVLAIKFKVYPLKNNFKQLVNKIFNKIQCFGYLKYIDVLISFSFLVFII